MRVATRHAILVTVFLALFAGCYRYTAIKPTELPRLTGPSYG